MNGILTVNRARLHESQRHIQEERVAAQAKMIEGLVERLDAGWQFALHLRYRAR